MVASATNSSESADYLTLGPLGRANDETVGYCWVSPESTRVETLLFEHKAVTVYSFNNEGVQSVKIAPETKYPFSNLVIGQHSYTLDGKTYVECSGD